MGKRRPRWVPQRVRRQLAAAKGRDWLRKLVKRQNGRCHYCRRPFYACEGEHPRRATLDHRLPTSRGGEHHWENVVAACWRCNQDKSDMTEEEFIEARCDNEAT